MRALNMLGVSESESSASHLCRFKLLIAVNLAAALLIGYSIPSFGAESPVAQAANAADIDAVRALISEGADVKAAASDGSTALLWAAYHSFPEMAAILIDAGAEVDTPNNFGITPLLQASSTGDAKLIELLLERGADPSLAHPDGVTPLMAAAQTGRVAAVDALLKRGADPNATDGYQQQTALMWAAAEGHLDVVDLLLESGADPNAQARISVLTERKNADFPSGGFTAVMWAARNGDEAVLRRLVAAGADLAMRNGDGATAMMITIVNDRFDLAATLLELGADPNDGSLYHAVEMRDATTDWYARDGSRLRANHDNERTALDLIELLLENGADPNKGFVGQMHSATMCCDSFANASPFYRAAMAADVAALELLIAHGADVEWMPARVESTAMRANANVGKAPVLVAMNGGKGVPLSAGPGYSREGPPPFREPSNRDPADALAVLLAAGANPDVLTPDGETLLHDAVRARKTDVMRVLAEGGATLDIQNKDGLTALFLAENPLVEEDSGPFGPRADRGEASPEEVAELMRELIETAGVQPAQTDSSGVQ